MGYSRKNLYVDLWSDHQLSITCGSNLLSVLPIPCSLIIFSTKSQFNVGTVDKKTLLEIIFINS